MGDRKRRDREREKKQGGKERERERGVCECTCLVMADRCMNVSVYVWSDNMSCRVCVCVRVCDDSV